MSYPRLANYSPPINKEKATNKIDGIVALAMASLEAIRGSSQPFGVLGAF